MFLLIFVFPYVLASFQHMQSSQLSSVSFLCFVFFRDCFVEEGKWEQGKSEKAEKKKGKEKKKEKKKGQVLVMSFRV